MDTSQNATEDALANAVASVFEGALGQPPSGVRVLSETQSVIVLVVGTETPFERSLAAAGEQQLILRERAALRNALATPLRAAVERCIGGAVTALSGSHDPESGTETLSFSLGRSAPALL